MHFYILYTMTIELHKTYKKYISYIKYTPFSNKVLPQYEVC